VIVHWLLGATRHKLYWKAHPTPVLRLVFSQPISRLSNSGRVSGCIIQQGELRTELRIRVAEYLELNRKISRRNGYQTGIDVSVAKMGQRRVRSPDPLYFPADGYTGAPDYWIDPKPSDPCLPCARVDYCQDRLGERGEGLHHLIKR
jgi:hypothetical protein